MLARFAVCTCWSARMRPTSMAFTSTLCGASSCDSALVMAMPAAREIDVGLLLGRGALAPMLSTLMMRPQRRSFICGAASRISRTAANSFNSRSSCRVSSVSLSNGYVLRLARLPALVLGTLDVAPLADIGLPPDDAGLGRRPDGRDRLFE